MYLALRTYRYFNGLNFYIVFICIGSFNFVCGIQQYCLVLSKNIKKKIANKYIIIKYILRFQFTVRSICRYCGN